MRGRNPHVPTPGVIGTSEWRSITFTVTTLKDHDPNDRAYIRLHLHGATGTTWYDQVRVQEVLATEFPQDSPSGEPHTSTTVRQIELDI